MRRAFTMSALLLLAAVMAAGCTQRLVISQPIATEPDAGDEERGGLVYSLPMTVIAVAGAQDRTTKAVTYTVTPAILPDPSARYRLKYGPSGFTDDDLNLATDSTGLLTSSKANATDKTGEIIVAIAKTAAAGGMQLAPSATKAKVEAYPFTVIFTVDEFLKPGGNPLPDDTTIVADDQWALPPKEMTGTAPSCSFSVCFRRVFPIKASICPDKCATPDRARFQFAFVAVNPHQTEGIDLKTASLVFRQNNVTFSSGLIQSVAINQPSTFLAIVSLPLTVLKEILKVPAELLTLKVNNVNAEANLAQAQATLLTQMKALIDAQQALDKARQAGKAPPVSGTGSSP